MPGLNPVYAGKLHVMIDMYIIKLNSFIDITSQKEWKKDDILNNENY